MALKAIQKLLHVSSKNEPVHTKLTSSRSHASDKTNNYKRNSND